MNILIKTFRKTARFVRTLGRDERGEDLTEGSSTLSNMGKVVIAGCVITCVAGGTVGLARSSTAAGDAVGGRIVRTVDVQHAPAPKPSVPFVPSGGGGGGGGG